MSSSSRPVRRRVLLVGAEGPGVGTLLPQQIKEVCRSWLKDDLAGKSQAGIPEDVASVHVAEGTDSRLTNVLRAAAKELGILFFEPASEQIMEARVRPLVGLPALVLPTESSVLNPVAYFKAEMFAAIALAGEMQAKCSEATAQLVATAQERDSLRTENERLKASRTRAVQYRVCVRKTLAKARHLVAMTERPQPIPPAEFAGDYEEICRQLLEKTAQLRKADERSLKEKTKFKAQLREQKELNDDLAKLVEERGQAIVKLHKRITELQAQTPVVAAKPAKPPKKVAKAKVVPKFTKLSELTDWLLEQHELTPANLIAGAHVNGLKLKPTGIKQAIQYAINRRNISGK